MFINRLFGLSVFLFIYLSFTWIEPVVLCCVLCLIYWVIYKDFYTLLIILFLLIPTPNMENYVGYEGKVVDVRPTYFIIENKGAKMIVYDDSHRVSFDDYISVAGTIKPIAKINYFYAFDYNQYLIDKGINSSLYSNKTTIIENGKTLKYYLYNYILTIDNQSIRDLYLKFIFNIKSDTLHELFLELGLCYFGLLECIRLLMKYRFSPKTIRIVQCTVLLCLIGVLGYSFILIRLLIGIIIGQLKIDQFKRFTIWFILIMVLFPSYIHSVSFIFPLAFRMINVFKIKNKRTFGFLISAIIQGLFFLRVNLLSVFCYQYLACFYGLLYLLLLLVLPLNWILVPCLPLLNYLLDLFKDASYTIVGKPNFFALVFIIIGCKLVKSPLVLLLTYLLIMNIGGFNLFYEVTFINVGQGDSVLISTPFNREIILYDTGKSNQYQILNATLQAKGIKQIDYLIISHQDEDHDGSKVKLMGDYDVSNIIEQCVDIPLTTINFSCLTPASKGQDNNDSLVYHLQVGKINFLLTGDISTKIENELIRKYQLDIDVLKIAHHGSKTSSSFNFLEMIEPEIAIISTNGQYNHPSITVINSLAKLSIPTKITRDSGDIRFILFDLFNLMHTSNQEFGIIIK